MPDNPPISTTSQETVTVDTGADKELLGNLNDQFADFWKEEDTKADAPAAPGEGAAQETREKPREKPDRHPEPELKIPDEAEPPADKELSDEDFEKLSMPQQTRPETVEDFKRVKELWKADRERYRAEADRVKTLNAQLQEAKANSWTPEAKADYEHAAAVRRKFDFSSDPEFIQKFQQPVLTAYHSILNETVDVLPDRGQAVAWAKYIAENYSPDSLDRNWWLNSVIAKIPNEMDRASVLQSVTNLLKMQKERDTEVTRRTNDKSAYDNWIKERDLIRSQWEVKEVMDEIGIQEQKIKEVLKKDPTEAKTKEEREAIEVHNERFEKLNGHFQETMKDLSFNGPRAKVRAAVEATRAMYIEGEYKNLEKELKSVKAECDQLRTELDKIAGARRRISQTSGTPPTPSGKDAKKQTGDGLSIKDLDVRNSFKNFDWGE
jgi:hypothetical protein